MLRFRVLGASFPSLGCSVFEFWVLRASVFVFECFVFETTLKLPSFDLGSTVYIFSQAFYAGVDPFDDFE